MKLLTLILLFLIPITSMARLKVDITNFNGRKMFNEFDTQAEMDAYLLKVSRYWGKSKWVEVDCDKNLGERISPTTSNQEYLCPDDFSFTITDITAKHNAKLALETIQKDMAFGKDLYAKIRLMNIGKPKAVRDAMRAALAPIRNALLDGDICSAYSDIAAITPDANITAQNLADVLALVDVYKTCN